jgi:hypothetical protein
VKPVTLIGIVAMVVAMVLYSIGAWGAFRAKKMSNRNVMFIFGGVVFDILGTVMMYMAAGNRFLWGAAHTWAAFLAFFGMLGAGIVGAWALSARKDDLLVKLSRWTLAPWALWAFSFLWGMAQPPKV